MEAIHSHKTKTPPQYELAEIFRTYGQSFRENNLITSKQSRVISAISLCHTGFLGIHKQSCDKCGFTEYLHNSCRDRHCSKCQHIAKEKWLNSRMKELLPVAYFHVIFTLPHQLSNLVYQNQQLLYNLFFKCSSATILQFGRNNLAASYPLHRSKWGDVP